MSDGKVLRGVRATEDMSAFQYKAVDIDGTLAAAAGTAIGILQNKPGNAEDASILLAGPSRYRAGGAIAAGGKITLAASGWFTAAGSGDDVVGRAYASVTSGSIGQGDFNFLSGQN